MEDMSLLQLQFKDLDFLAQAVGVQKVPVPSSIRNKYTDAYSHELPPKPANTAPRLIRKKSIKKIARYWLSWQVYIYSHPQPTSGEQESLDSRSVVLNGPLHSPFL